jgi:hypothetical protein
VFGCRLSASLLCPAHRYVSFVEIFSAKAVDGFEAAGYTPEEATRYATLCFFGGMVVIWLLDKLVHAILHFASHGTRALDAVRRLRKRRQRQEEKRQQQQPQPNHHRESAGGALQPLPTAPVKGGCGCGSQMAVAAILQTTSARSAAASHAQNTPPQQLAHHPHGGAGADGSSERRDSQGDTVAEILVGSSPAAHTPRASAAHHYATVQLELEAARGCLADAGCNVDVAAGAAGNDDVAHPAPHAPAAAVPDKAAAAADVEMGGAAKECEAKSEDSNGSSGAGTAAVAGAGAGQVDGSGGGGGRKLDRAAEAPEVVAAVLAAEGGGASGDGGGRGGALSRMGEFLGVGCAVLWCDCCCVQALVVVVLW